MSLARQSWIAVFLLVGIGFLASPADAQRPQQQPTDRQQLKALNDAVRTKLRQEIDLDVIETPLVDVTRQISDQIGETINLDLVGLEESSITPDQLINLRLETKRADVVLRALLQPLNLVLVVHDGLLIVTSKRIQATRYATPRAYDVRDLLENANTFSQPLPHSEPVDPALGGMIEGGPVGGAAMGSGSMGPSSAKLAGPLPALAPESPADYLVSLICDSVAPDSWKHRGGTATAQIFGGMLVVRHTDDVQAEIDDLLQEMRGVVADDEAE